MTAIEFLTRAGQTNAPHREFSLISSVLGASALVDALNNPRVSTETESSNLGPFFTEDAPEGASRLSLRVCGPIPYHCTAVPLSESIASEGKGEYMYVQGQVRDTSGAPIPCAVIDTWEPDDKGEGGIRYALFLIPPIPMASTILSMRMAESEIAAVASWPIKTAGMSTAPWFPYLILWSST